jgi:serralysin
MDFAGNELNQIIIGNDGVNGLEGRGGPDTLFGLGGNDFLDGGAGNDVTVGGPGDDAHFVDSANDAVLEAAGEGNDRVLASVSYTLGGTAEVELISAADQAATTALDLTGNGSNQIIFGNEGVNALDGGGGADTLRGLGGNDIYLVDSNDTVVEAAGGGNDRVLATTSYTLPLGAEVELLSAANQAGTAPLTLIGNELPNNIQANEGDNVLAGGGGPDTLFGLGGSDVLNGGPGNDMLIGGAGGDGIVFSAILAPGHVDTVIGFAPGQDRLFLDDAVFTALATGALPAGAFRTGTAAQDADDRIIYDPATGAVFYDPDGNGTAVAQIQFAVLQGAPAVSVTDFLVI